MSTLCIRPIVPNFFGHPKRKFRDVELETAESLHITQERDFLTFHRKIEQRNAYKRTFEQVDMEDDEGLKKRVKQQEVPVILNNIQSLYEIPSHTSPLHVKYNFPKKQVYSLSEVLELIEKVENKETFIQNIDSHERPSYIV